MKSHEEIVKVVEETISLKAPFEKFTMRFIHDPEAGWNQIETTKFFDCAESTFSIENVVKTGLCQTRALTHAEFSNYGEVGDYVYRVLANTGKTIDKGFQENFWKGINQEHYAMRMDQLAELLETNIEYAANLINLLF